MSVGLGLLHCLLVEKRHFSAMRDAQMDEKVLEGDEAEVYRFVEQYQLEFSKLPEVVTVERETGVVFPKFPNEPFGYWVQGVEKRAQSNLILAASKEMKESVSRGELQEAREQARHLVVDLEHRSPSDRVHNLQLLAPGVLAEHDVRQRRGSISGVPFGIEYLDQVSDGAQPGDTVALVGRPSVGKTYLMLQMATNGYDLDRTGVPLWVTLEMQVEQCARRLMALRTGLSATMIRLGRLSHWGRQKLSNGILELRDLGERPFYMLQGGFRTTIEDLLLRVQELRPSALYIDGAYLLRTRVQSDSRWERITEAAEMQKEISREFKIPVIASYQFNRRGPGSLANIGGCLSGMSIMATRSGLKRIGELYGIVDAWNGARFVTGTVIKTGRKKKFRVILEDGTAVEGSSDHRFKIWKGSGDLKWERCKRLQPGGRCVVFGAFAGSGAFPPLQHPDVKTNGLYVRVPTAWSEALAEVMGLLVGDGSCTSETSWEVTFDTQDWQTRELFARKMLTIFGYPVSLKEAQSKRGSWITAVINSKSVLRIFRQLGVPCCKAPEKYVPSSILAAPPKIRGAFLRGLFDADGSIAAGSARNEIRFASHSERLAQDVQILLRSLGIDSLVLKKKDREKCNIVRVYRSEVAIFAGSVGFLSVRKKDRLLQALAAPSEKNRRGKCCWKDGKAELLKVERVEDTGEYEEMFDFVSDSPEHAFVANGVVVHNSDAIGQLASIVIGIDDEHVAGHAVWSAKQYKILELLKGREGEKGRVRVLYDMEAMKIAQEEVITGYDDGSIGDVALAE
jgi:replicative DNA helicase